MAGNAFDINGQAVAATAFVHDGVEYAKDRPFPHKSLGLHVAAVRGLWLADKINFVDEAPVVAPVAPVAPTPPKRFQRR